jgi:carbamoyltransferase
LLGPSFGDEAIRAALDARKLSHRHFSDETELLAETACAIAEGGVVGWFQGRMEFGPRALGSRSILGDPRNAGMQARMNLRIKFRESFRPFAPSCLAEDAAHWFDLDRESPYMLLVAPVRAEHRTTLDDAQQTAMRDPDLRRRVNVVRSTLPAITHVDFSARVQTVSDERNGRYARLIREFKRQTGCGVLVNTSFNVRGEPIVCTPEDAVRCFLATEMDMLVLGNFILRKSGQAPIPEAERARHLQNFQPD